MDCAHFLPLSSLCRLLRHRSRTVPTRPIVGAGVSRSAAQELNAMRADTAWAAGVADRVVAPVRRVIKAKQTARGCPHSTPALPSYALTAYLRRYKHLASLAGSLRQQAAIWPWNDIARRAPPPLVRVRGACAPARVGAASPRVDSSSCAAPLQAMSVTRRVLPLLASVCARRPSRRCVLGAALL